MMTLAVENKQNKDGTDWNIFHYFPPSTFFCLLTPYRLYIQQNYVAVQL